jgi:hypothetical protein
MAPHSPGFTTAAGPVSPKTTTILLLTNGADLGISEEILAKLSKLRKFLDEKDHRKNETGTYAVPVNY